MPLELRKRRHGTLRSTFYGRYIDKYAKRKCINLQVKIEGEVPKSLRHTGDSVFEAARERAEDKLRGYEKEGRLPNPGDSALPRDAQTAV